MYVHTSVYMYASSLQQKPTKFYSDDGTILFDTLNLNSQASWYSDQPEGRPLNMLCLHQLEKDTVFIGMDRIHLSPRLLPLLLYVHVYIM